MPISMAPRAYTQHRFACRGCPADRIIKVADWARASVALGDVYGWGLAYNPKGPVAGYELYCAECLPKMAGAA